MDASLFVGFDIGGSGVRAAVADARGDVLAAASASSVEEALGPIAPIAADRPSFVFVGTRGLSVPGRREALLTELGAHFPRGRVRIGSDAQIALWGGLAGGEGVVVAAGTGSIALARTADGRESRAGGWGYLLGDDGSAYWIGREALRAYLHDRAMADHLSATVGATVVDVLAWVYAPGDQVARIASLAVLVSAAASAGDSEARDILKRAGRALAEMAFIAAREVGLVTPTVACCGGVWRSGFVSDAFDTALQGTTRVAPRLPPVGGALLLAMGETVSKQVVDALRATLSDPGVRLG